MQVDTDQFPTEARASISASTPVAPDATTGGEMTPQGRLMAWPRPLGRGGTPALLRLDAERVRPTGKTREHVSRNRKSWPISREASVPRPAQLRRERTEILPWERLE
jgi:hypothetical protein